MEITSDLIAKKFVTLPEGTQAALLSNKFILITTTLAVKHALSDKQEGNLMRVETMLIMDLITKNDLVQRIQDEVGVMKDKAELIAKDVVDHVLGRLEEMSASDITDDELEKSLPKAEDSKSGGLDILDNKLTGVVTSAPDLPAHAPSVPATPSMQPAAPQSTPRLQDPYREPIE